MGKTDKAQTKKKVNKPAKKGRKRSLKLIDFLLIFCVVVLIVSVCGLVGDFADRVKAAKELKDIQKQSPITNIDVNQSVEANAVKAAETLRTLKVINPDIIAWMDIPDTALSMPVVQCSNNSYYLYHSFTEDYTDAGAIFVDYENSSDFSDQNTVIYGHARLDGTMFAPLKRYRSQSFYEEHPFMTLVTENKIYYYQVFSANTLEAYYDYRSSSYGDRFMSFISEIRASSVVDSSASVNNASRIIALSTCTNVIEDGRFVVFLVLLNPDGEQIDLEDYPL